MADAAVIDSRTLYLRLLRYVHPYRRTFAISLLSMVLLACTEPILPALLKPLLDGSFIEQDAGARLTVPGLLVLLFLFRGGITYASDVSVNWVAQKVVLDLRQQMFRNLMMLPSTYFDTTNSSVLISKLSFDVAQVAQAATRGVTVLVKDSLAVLGLFCYMLYLNWMLSFMVLIIAPVVGFVILGASRRLRVMSQKVQHSMGAITEVAQEAIDCHKAVKIYHGRDHETGRFYRAADENRKFTMKIATVSAANVPIIQALMAVVLAAVTYLAATLSVAGELTLGDFVAFFTAMTLLLPPIKRITGINEHLQRGLAAAQSVFSLIDEAPEPDSGARDCKRAHGYIEYENVRLVYEPHLSPALHGISVKIEAGETIALVGPSGSGKSSFANLLPRFYHPSRGRILLDGVDIADLSLHALRRNIALVTQEVLLFNDTVRNNIAYGGMREASAAAIQRAVEAAHVSDFIATMPEGLDTLIGENGVRLSGGQRQRLAIARAILKDAPLLILDEATSSLDSISEQHIQAALETLRRGRTCIIIAHRLSTIENADRIIVLKQGKIEEIGTHDELLRRHGTYARLHRLQFRSHAAAIDMYPRRGEETAKTKKTRQDIVSAAKPRLTLRPMATKTSALAEPCPGPADPPIRVGWREWVALPDLHLPAIKAKMDSGARTSALHTFKLHTYETAGQLKVEFWLHPLQCRNDITRVCTADVVDSRTVRDSGGHREQRFVIRSIVRFMDRAWPIEITLTNRENMLFRLLLARTAMAAGGLIVDPGKSFVGGRALRRVYLQSTQDSPAVEPPP